MEIHEASLAKIAAQICCGYFKEDKMINSFLKRKVVATFLCLIALPLSAWPFLSWATPPGIDVKFYEALEREGNYYWTNEVGNSLVQVAINTGQYELALRLLDHDVLNHLPAKFPLSSVVIDAFYSINLEIIKKIIDVAKRDGKFNTLPLTEGMAISVMAGDSQTINFLLEEGISLKASAKKSPEMLVEAIWEKQYLLAWALIGRGISLKPADVKDWSALQTAVWRGNKELVAYLLEEGADFVTRNSDGKNAIEIAVSNAEENKGSDFAILDLLVEKGADPCDKNLKIEVEAKNYHKDPIQQFIKESSNKAFLEKFATYKCKFID